MVSRCCSNGVYMMDNSHCPYFVCEQCGLACELKNFVDFKTVNDYIAHVK